MVELKANNQVFELQSGVDIKYTKQISDIFDLAVVASSYTNGFKIQKTPNNTQIMKQLGIVGDTSIIPYSKVESSLKHYGFDLFKNGWLKVQDTTDYYNVSCADGMIDFFKAIENKTMGKDLNLQNFNHIKDLDTVLSSFANTYYKYIVADYNGKNLSLSTFFTERINIDYLVPCFNMGKLFDLVMTTFGFEYNNAGIEEINDLFITYPKNPAENNIDFLVADLHLRPFGSPIQSMGNGYYTSYNLYKMWFPFTIIEGSLIQAWQYVIPETSGYALSLSTEMYALYRSNIGNYDYKPMKCSILVNGNSILDFDSDPLAAVVNQFNVALNIGDIVEFSFRVTPLRYYTGQIGEVYFQLDEIRHNVTDFKIYKTNLGNVNLTDAFKDYSIKDFIKEVFIRTATTPIIDNFNKSISFKTVAQRLGFSNAIDWSDKFVRRKKETYIQGSYAQKNGFTHKHNDPDDISQNGYLYVNNENIDDYKDLYDSKIYAPELVLYTFPEGIKTNKFPIWNRQAKEDSNGVVSIEYKGLNSRFFIIKYKLTPIGSYAFASDAIPSAQTVTQYPYADTDGTTYDQIVPLKYNAYNGVLNNFRAHEIELALSFNDFYGLDMTRTYYFKQEGMNYILNRLMFEEGKTVVGEFIRINKVLN